MVGRFLHPNGLLLVFIILGVNMFWGHMLFIFSVSATLKSYGFIIAYIILNVNIFFSLIFQYPENAYIVYIPHFTKVNNRSFSLKFSNRFADMINA